jgi:hypothetical protein
MWKVSHTTLKIFFALTIATVTWGSFAATPLSWVYVRVSGDDFGYYDPSERKLVIDPMFNSAQYFSTNKLAVANKDGVWGFIRLCHC